ncbi:MAG: alginate export family protein, partial [Phycisphaerae bacterium]|nr:alginate export family protein [Phycisphaerae bacterium]
MKTTHISISVTVAVAVLVVPALLVAEVPAPDQQTSTFEDVVKRSKQPVSWFKWGADLRLREVFTPNLLLNQEDRHFQRYRLRTWATITPVENLDINMRLVYEPKHFCQPSREAKARKACYIDEWTVSEALFDKMNIKWSKALNLPLTVTVGRQDMMFGNNWLILDGTPLDGSRTIFFDAARVTIDLEEIKTKIDLVYIDQHADSDRWIKPFCDKDFHNIEQDERGAIVYVTNKSLPKTQIDGYFIYKNDRADLGTETGDVGTNRLAPWQTGTDGNIYAFGGRIAGSIGDAWKYRAEMAQEFGHKNGANICAFGANARLEYHLNDNHKNSFNTGYEYLSGDDPDTGTNEQFDPLWGRWPQFSELLAYTVALENRPGETTNLHRFFLGYSCKPTDKLTFDANYHLL